MAADRRRHFGCVEVVLASGDSVSLRRLSRSDMMRIAKVARGDIARFLVAELHLALVDDNGRPLIGSLEEVAAFFGTLEPGDVVALTQALRQVEPAI